MNIHPVKTDQDYHAALERIEALWSAEPETPEGARGGLFVCAPGRSGATGKNFAETAFEKRENWAEY